MADLQFQSKAVASFSRIIQSDRTILLATHSLTFVAKYCSRVLWLEKGELKMTGTPAEVIPAYTQFCLPDGEAAKTLPAASESSIPPEERLP